MKKIAIASIILGSALAASLSFANPKSNFEAVPHLKRFTVGSGQINCDKHLTDICIVNKSDEEVSFSIPQLRYSFVPLPRNQWADVFSNDNYYPSLQVVVYNINGIPIFNNSDVPNHSIIEIDPGLKGSSKLKVKIHN